MGSDAEGVCTCEDTYPETIIAKENASLAPLARLIKSVLFTFPFIYCLHNFKIKTCYLLLMPADKIIILT